MLTEKWRFYHFYGGYLALNAYKGTQGRWTALQFHEPDSHEASWNSATSRPYDEAYMKNMVQQGRAKVISFCKAKRLYRATGHELELPREE